MLITALRCRLLLRFHEEEASAESSSAEPSAASAATGTAGAVTVTSEADLMAAAAQEYLRSAMVATDEHAQRVPLSLAVGLFMSVDATTRGTTRAADGSSASIEDPDPDPDRPAHPIMRVLTQLSAEAIADLESVDAYTFATAPYVTDVALASATAARAGGRGGGGGASSALAGGGASGPGLGLGGGGGGAVAPSNDDWVEPDEGLVAQVSGCEYSIQTNCIYTTATSSCDLLLLLASTVYILPKFIKFYQVYSSLTTPLPSPLPPPPTITSTITIITTTTTTTTS